MNELYTRLTPRLIVGSASDALEFYTQAFGAVPGMVLRDPTGAVVHAEMDLAGLRMSLTESDGSHAKDPQQLEGTPVILTLMCDPDEVAAQAVAHGATVMFPIEDRPYGMRDGRVVDPFGHHWLLTRTLEHLSEAELQARMTGG